MFKKISLALVIVYLPEYSTTCGAGMGTMNFHSSGA
jgi:hypothetical protein